MENLGTEHTPNISLLIFIKMDAFCLEANDPLINIPDHDEKSLCHNSCHIIAVLFCQASSIVRRNRPLSSTKCFTSKVYKPFQSTGCLSSTCFLSARISQLCKFFLGKVVIFHFLIGRHFSQRLANKDFILVVPRVKYRVNRVMFGIRQKLY